MLQVTYFNREPRKTAFSIEGIFEIVKASLEEKVRITDFSCDPKLSRRQNIKRARKFASSINHITGDVNFLSLGLKKRKNVLTIHDMGHYETLLKRNLLQFFVYKYFWFKLPLKHISIVTVISEFTKQSFLKYFSYPEENIRVIYDPVKPVFQYTPRLSINNIPHILQIGTGWNKNLTNLIESVRGLDVHIDIIGWPSAADIEKLNTYNIAYTVYNGLTDQQVYERYVACDILFFASHYEGFGMPIIEAQAVGRPVITSNIGAMKEVAADTAVLVAPENTAAIRSAIERLITDNVHYNSMVTAGLQNIQQYMPDVIANKYLEVYKELAAS